MVKQITTAEAQAFRDRWACLNAAEKDELRRTPISLKLRQLAALMASARLFARPEADDREADEVRARWRRLRRALT